MQIFANNVLRSIQNCSKYFGCRIVPSSRQLVIPVTNVRHFHDGKHDVCPSHIMGIDHLHNARLNKGLAFTLEERQSLGIHGLQAARIITQDEQIDICMFFLNRLKNPINKYIYLTELHERNERLFFRLLSENVEKLMPIVYTPTVGLVCQTFGLIYRRARGLFITSNDRGYILNILKNWPESDVRVIVVTDGERILGLGDLGAYGMGIPVGKLSLCTGLAGIEPHHCLPIQLDCGTNNTKLRNDKMYIGLRQPRLTGKEYDDFIDEFMKAVAKRYGRNTLIQFEDFGIYNAFRLLNKYRHTYCTFNDDIQGTAAVTVGGLFASQKLTGNNLSANIILFAGAGGASVGIANLCVSAMSAEGISLEEARSKIYMVDIDGLLTTSRIEKLSKFQKHYAKDHEPLTDLLEIVQKFNPSILIGASTKSGIFTPQILQHMAKQHERPIVFALSNPTSYAECTPDEAFQNTEGRVIYSAGSPFPPVEYDGKTYRTGQANNAFIFPGLAFGVIATKAYQIPDEMFLIAAKQLAKTVSVENLEGGSIYPPLSNIREVSLQIATKIAKYAFCHNLATIYPEPENIRLWLENQSFKYNYNSAIPEKWKWPEEKQFRNDKSCDNHNNSK